MRNSRTSSSYPTVNPVETREGLQMSNEMYKSEKKMCPKSKNQIQMVEVNQEVEFDSDY